MTLAPIYGFYTVCTDNAKAFPIFEEQMKRLETSGLAQAMSKFIIVMAGKTTIDTAHLSFHAKIVPYHCTDVIRGELYTLFELLKLAQQERFDCFYFHSKGCTHTGELFNYTRDWRLLLEYFIIDRWKENISLLRLQYDTLGVNEAFIPHPHYNGNFWWSKSSYIKSLPNPYTTTVGFSKRFENEEERSQHNEAFNQKGFDCNFVKATFGGGSSLQLVPNLSAFVALYEIDWLWYTTYYSDLAGYSAEKAVLHWKEHGKSEKRIPTLSEHKDYNNWKRVNAEFWIKEQSGTHHSLYNSNVWHYTCLYPVSKYNAKNRRLVAVLVKDCTPQGLKLEFNNSSSVEYRLFLNIPGRLRLDPLNTSLYALHAHAYYSYFDTDEQLKFYEGDLRGRGFDSVVVL